MTGSRAGGPAAPPARWLPGLAVAAVTLLLVMLPALVAGARLAAPAAPGELERVRQALASSQPGRAHGVEVHSELAHAFLRSMVVGAADGVRGDESALLARARLAQVLVLLGLGGVLYTVVLLAGDRLRALLACAWFAVLPPVATEGHVLRAETAAVLFVWLGLAVLLGLAGVRRARRGRPRRELLVAGCAVLCSCLGIATQPRLGLLLLVPGVVMMLSAAQLVVRVVVVVRRRGLLHWPYAATNRRLLPWIGTALLTPLVAWWLLQVVVVGPSESLLPTRSEVGLLPGAGPWRAVVVALLWCGGLGGVFRLGLALGQRSSLAPALVVWTGVLLALLGGLADPNADRLPQVPAAAIVLAEGCLWAVFLMRRAWRSGRPR